MRFSKPFALIAALFVAGCVTPEPEVAPMNFVMQWDHRPEAAAWTTSTVTQIETSPLVRVVPSDITAWCPAYTTGDVVKRAAFWSATMSAIARYESTWNPAAKGGRGRYHGMMQISPQTASSAGCSGSLFDGGNNLMCATKIAARQAGDGRSVSQILGDWGPMHDSSKRSAMAAWTSQQSYCKG
jgi:hypothetical protein